jgi:rhamnose transport system permease protein
MRGPLLRLLQSREIMLIVVLLGLFLYFSFTVDYFFDAYNILERTRHWVAPGIIAIAMTFIIATGGIDLSVGSMLALSGVVLGMVYEDAGLPIWVACLAALATGLLAGGVNGFFGSYVGVPPLVVTLATMTLFRGLAMGLSEADSVSRFPPGFQWLGQGGLFPVTAGAHPVLFPFSTLALLALFAAGAAVFRRTWLGRYTELIGENETASRFAAIEVDHLKFGIYAACGLLCGLGAVFYTSYANTAMPDAAQGLELKVIACVVIGGTRISGGRGSVVGTLLGLFIIGILEYGLEMAGVAAEKVIIVVGLVLIVTAVFNEWMARRQSGEVS